MSFDKCKIYVCESENDWGKYKDKFTGNEYLGFDVESQSDKADTIQFSTMNECCVLHVSKFNKIPQTVKDLLESKDISKIGVGVHDDFDLINKTFGIKCEAGLDVGWLAYVIGTTVSYRNLDFLSEKLLGEQKLKSTGGWRSEKLTKSQYTYAGKDAWLGVAIANKIYDVSLSKKEKRHMDFSTWAKHYETDPEDIKEYKESLENKTIEAFAIDEDVEGNLNEIQKAKKYQDQLRREEKEELKRLEELADSKEKKPKDVKEKGEKKEKKKEEKPSESEEEDDDFVTNII